MNRFAEKMLDFSALLKHMVRSLTIVHAATHMPFHSPKLLTKSYPSQNQNQTSVEPFLVQSHSLLAYANAHRGVIKLRDQKQLDFEELSAYLSAIVSERDRLAALSSGHAGTPVGLGTYLRDQVDRLRGTDDIHTRRERMRKLDGRIKEVCSLCRSVGPMVGDNTLTNENSCKKPSLPLTKLRRHFRSKS